MTYDAALLKELGLAKGDEPMTTRQFQRRIEHYQNSIWPLIRQKDPTLTGEYGEWLKGHYPTLEEAKARLVFNGRLAAYRAAQARLAKYELAAGRPEIIEDVPTGEFDQETGEVITQSVVVAVAVDPQPATITQPTYDEVGEHTGEEEVPNPAIVQDQQERAEAQAVMDAMPQEVKDFDAA